MSDQHEIRKLLVDAKTAAEMFDCGVSTFWKRVKSGVYPAPVKDGGSTRWRVSDLERHVQAMPTTTPSTHGAEISTQPGYTQP